MIKPQPGPVLGGLAGLIALIVVVVKLLSPSAQVASLQAALDEFLGKFQAVPSETRFREVDKNCESLEQFVNDPAFDQLPTDTQSRVRGLLADLTDYRTFSQRLLAIAAPHDTQSEQELQRIKAQLQQLDVPVAQRQNWANTEPVRRQRDWLDEVKAIDLAVYDVRQGYRKLADDGNHVLQNRNAPELPRRARAVLERADQFPSPVRDRDKQVPGAGGLTYAQLFQFPTVAEPLRTWEQVRERLKPLAVE